MAISITDVQVGKFFVCAHLVREIVQEEAGENILYYTYLLKTGDPLYETSDKCSKRQIAHWAEREATPQEISLMKTHETRSLEANQKINLAIQSAAKFPNQT